MRIYISHPIAGKTEAEKAASEDQGTYYAKYLLSGEAILPRKIGPGCGQQGGPLDEDACSIPGKFLPGDIHSVQCYMRGDIAEMLTCDAILIMPGWQASAGCRDEVNVAAMCGLPIHFYTENHGIGGMRVR